MKIEFLKPRFTGARFDEHTLPVDVARDLAAYAELMKLEDGWYEGQGKAPDKTHLEWATEALVKSFPEDLPFPLTAPTSEGGLFLEWIQTPWRISAEFLLPTHKCELQATNTSIGLSEEKALDLDQTGNWMALFEFVRKHV